VTDQISASFLQNHGNATFLVDAAAASNLTRFRFPLARRAGGVGRADEKAGRGLACPQARQTDPEAG
jgi:hypothetical protein